MLSGGGAGYVENGHIAAYRLKQKESGTRIGVRQSMRYTMSDGMSSIEAMLLNAGRLDRYR